MIHEGLPLSRATQVGSIRIHGIEAGAQQLDGGAMFGVVPKPLWERRIPRTRGTAFRSRSAVFSSRRPMPSC